MSNIWTAASEGDLPRVQQLIESGLSPNVLDDNSYTPIHAAASWGHIEILNYLILEKGGDINIVDGDGETPLFLVESAQMARIIVGLGGNPGKRNAEGMSPAQSLQEEYPHIALYLRSLTGEPTPALPASNSNSMDVDSESSSPPSTSAVSIPTNQDLDESTDSLIYRVKMIMEASERGEYTSEETDEKLREVVEEVVRGQVDEGKRIGEGLEGGDGGAMVREREEVEGEGEAEVGEGEGKGKRRRDEGAR